VFVDTYDIVVRRSRDLWRCQVDDSVVIVGEEWLSDLYNNIILWCNVGELLFVLLVSTYDGVVLSIRDLYDGAGGL
jgi:hypothetical protein